MTAPASQWRWRGTAGDSDANNVAFRNSLLGPGPLTVSTNHWLAVVLASQLPPALANRVAVTMRLTIFVFLPAIRLAPSSLQTLLPYYPLLKRMGKFLQALLDAGMPFDELPSATEARACVLVWAAKLSDAARLFNDSHLCQIGPPADWLGATTAALVTGSDTNHARMADLLCLLVDWMTTAGQAGADYADRVSLLIPAAARLLAAGQQAVRTIAHFRKRHAGAINPLLVRLVPYADVGDELDRMLEPAEADRFAPLFDARHE